jgi:hypothetical protein
MKTYEICIIQFKEKLEENQILEKSRSKCKETFLFKKIVSEENINLRTNFRTWR